MENTKRFLGIELFRGLSTYAVILAHSGDENWGIPILSNAIEFRLHFYFAVPFFLAAAFFFMTAKPEIAYSQRFWKSRLERIVIPYIIWSFIFWISRVIIFTLSKKFDRLQQLLQDPLSVSFFGGASYHLYFLPLLMAGTFLMLSIKLFTNPKISALSLALFTVISIIFYHLLEVTGNSFQLGNNISFQGLYSNWHINSEQNPLLRLFLVEFSWMIRCLPYFFVALILHKSLPEINFLYNRLFSLGLAVLCLLCNTLGLMFLPGSLQEVIMAYLLLLFGISLSHHFRSILTTNLAASVGLCSFGIYLIHPFIMNISKYFISKLLPGITSSISIPSMLVLSISCFLISWTLVAYLIKQKFISKYLFGA
jgi:peptidoglycan/LPS O-acetylase OafA/YrhL